VLPATGQRPRLVGDRHGRQLEVDPGLLSFL
jgi:hypothetical protein